MLDAKTQEVLNIILKKGKDSLSADEIGFLMARRSYLSDTERENYKGFFKDQEAGGKKGKKGKSEE